MIKTNKDGYYELYDSIITQNRALYATVSEVFSSQTSSQINNCSISENKAVDKSQILNEVLAQGKYSKNNLTYLIAHINSEYKEYLLDNENLLDQKASKS